MQEIVFIEAGLNRHSIGQSLNAALLTNGEMSLRPEGWKSFDDPLADWEDRAAAATAP